MVNHPEVEAAVDEILNEAISYDEEDIVKIVLDKVNANDRIKAAIEEAFQDVLDLLDFNKKAYDILRRWYIDGRLYFHAMINEADPKSGMYEIRYIDPRKIRKVREVIKQRAARGTQDTGLGEGEIQQTISTYFVYNERGYNYNNKQAPPTATGLKIAADSIVYVTSGLTDVKGTMVLSFLHKAIKTLNQLRTVEDATIIYTLSRAPERRVWYIDVGNLPKMKAEQYVRDIAIKHKNRLVYDASTGEVRDDRKFMTMMEDYWLPRREGGMGTKVETLPPGQHLGQMDHVTYFQRSLYASLNVPINRLNSESMFSLGRATEITRDEVKFARFISRLRAKFADLFVQLLEKQLVLKQVMTIEDFQIIKNKLRFDFAHDNYFAELKNQEVVQSRINTVTLMEQAMVIGKYYSHNWVRMNILQQTEEEILEMDQEIMMEIDNPILNAPPPGTMMPPMGPVQFEPEPQEEINPEDIDNNNKK